MMKGYIRAIKILVFMSALIVINYSCTEKTIKPIEPVVELGSCEECHTDYEMLKQVYTPDSVIPSGGCGGDAPYYEPYDRVYMDGSGYEAFKQSGHYSIGCTGCHNGNSDSDVKSEAHAGDFISHPSLFYEDKCGSCHEEITANFPTSIHNGTGQKRKVAIRSGFTGADDFDQLPEHQIEGYNENCAQCHGTCGNCHIVRPTAAGGGLAKGHAFTKTPDMLNVCVKCHSSRGGHAYLGVAAGTEPDVHITSQNFKCLDCHNGAEMHGNGEPVEQRYAYSELPECEECHTDLASSNNYHSTHLGDFNCQVCHSQDYNNCGQCHINFEDEHLKSGAGAQIPSYLGYKIAVNPLPELRPFESDFALVRRTLAAPENWDAYVENAYPNFNALPTYNFTTPHNILKYTSRTTVEEGQSCAYNCHIRNVDDSLYNKNLYLFEEDLLDWELEASRSITVDGKLPSYWFNAKK